jgi:hypothetical protein
MANVTIADLPSGAPLQTGDLLEIQRGADGPGSGKSCSIDDILTYVVTKKSYVANFGDGSNVTYTINHDLGTLDVMVEIYRNATPYDTVICDVNRQDVNNIVISGFATPPAVNNLRVMIRAI